MSRKSLYVKVKEDGTLEEEQVWVEEEIGRITNNGQYDENTFVLPAGYEPYIDAPQPSSLTKYDVVVRGPITKKNGTWSREYSVVEADEWQKSFIDGQNTYTQKTIRNQVLDNCDWTQLPDAQLSAEKKAEWAVYRQQLRDLPSHPGFPVHHEWPQRPR